MELKPPDSEEEARGKTIPWTDLCASLAFVVCFLGCFVVGYRITMALADNAVRGWYAPEVQDAIVRDSVRFGWVCPGLSVSLLVAFVVAALVAWMIRKWAEPCAQDATVEAKGAGDGPRTTTFT